MKFNNFDDNLLDYVYSLALALALALFFIGLIGAPITGFVRVKTTQKALNEQCNTHYTFMQVALAGDNLSRLCQIKNQTVTIK